MAYDWTLLSKSMIRLYFHLTCFYELTSFYYLLAAALVVGFDNLTSAVNIQEGTSMEFCVAILTPEIERDAEIFILTQPGNATG